MDIFFSSISFYNESLFFIVEILKKLKKCYIMVKEGKILDIKAIIYNI